MSSCSSVVTRLSRTNRSQTCSAWWNASDAYLEVGAGMMVDFEQVKITRMARNTYCFNLALTEVILPRASGTARKSGIRIWMIRFALRPLMMNRITNADTDNDSLQDDCSGDSEPLGDSLLCASAPTGSCVFLRVFIPVSDYCMQPWNR